MFCRCARCGHTERRGCLPELATAVWIVVQACFTIPLMFWLEVTLARRWGGEDFPWWWVLLMIPPAGFGGLIAAALASIPLELLEALFFGWRRCTRCGGPQKW